jgi:outer membrane protein assembly factor BamE (lipoprotein component of BamABCDE complex)
MRILNIHEASRSIIVNSVLLFTIFLGVLLFSTCTTTKEVQQNSTVKVEEQNSANKSESLSYGMVTSKVKKGVTTQQEIVELFGAPNITTLTSEGEESWVYEYTSTSSETKETSVSASKRFDVFFGLGLYGSKSGEEEKRITVDRSIRTLTVIIKFKLDKTVAEYSARASYF